MIEPSSHPLSASEPGPTGQDDDLQSLVHFEPLSPLQLDSLLLIEEQSYPHPWSRANFQDAMSAGYETQLLLNHDHELLGYFVAMTVLDEVHLLNITVSPAHQGKGWGKLMLDALALSARQKNAQWIWLEVRSSNERARKIYTHNGFIEVGQRKNYYPSTHGPRENAVLMSLKLWP